MISYATSRRNRIAFLDPRSWNVERAVFVLGFALVALSPLPFAMQVGLDVLFGMEAMTAIPAMLLAAIALVTGSGIVFALAGIATLAPVAYVIGYATGGRVLANPLAGGEFVSQALLLAGAAIALPAGVAVLVRERRGTATPLRRALSSPHTSVALVIAALVAGASASAALASTQEPPITAGDEIGFAPDAQAELTMQQLAFTPSVLVLRAAAVTQLRIENLDTIPHTFTYEVEGKLFDHALPGGAVTSVLLRFDAPGEITFWCKPHAHKQGGTYAGMVGTILVESAS